MTAALPTGPPRVNKTVLLEDFGDDAGAHRMAALADRETKTFLHRDRHDQIHLEKTAEISTEQNYNMVDGIMNNTHCFP